MLASFLQPARRRLCSASAADLLHNSLNSDAYSLRLIRQISTTDILMNKKRSKRRNFGVPNSQGSKQESEETTPTLKDTLRRLQVLVHPDKFGHAPQAQASNEASLATLQGFLSSIRSLEGEYPPASNAQLRFYVPRESGGLSEVKASLRSTGGNCRNLISQQLGDLFHQCGLPRTFHWDSQSWVMGDAPVRPNVNSEEDVYETRSTAAPEYNFHNPHKKPDPPQQAQQQAAEPVPPKMPNIEPTIVKEEISLDQLNQVKPDLPDSVFENVDPVLAAIASFPWLKKTDEKAALIEKEAVGQLEDGGFNIRAGINMIWGGERDFGHVKEKMSEMGIVDGKSLALLSRILYHTREIEEEVGEAKGEL